jgi:hypothetical protein
MGSFACSNSALTGSCSAMPDSQMQRWRTDCWQSSHFACETGDWRLANDARIDLHQVLLASTTGEVRIAPPASPVTLRPSEFALGQAYPNPFNP